MRAEIFTIFPELVSTWAGASLIGKAWRSGAIDIVVHDLRAGANDPRRSVDDSPFGGGAGMVLAPEPLFAAVEAAQPVRPLYLLGPGGRRFDQAMARELAAGPGFSLLCGRYEGVDERVAEHLVDGELSIGDFVLAGGEAAAAVVVEAVARLVPGRHGQCGLDRRGELHRRAARVPAVHEARRVPRLARPRGALVWSPLPCGRVEEGLGTRPHAGAPARFDSRAGRNFSGRGGTARAVGVRCSNLS